MLRALDEDLALHLLPPLCLAPGGPSAYLPPAGSPANASAVRRDLAAAGSTSADTPSGVFAQQAAMPSAAAGAAAGSGENAEVACAAATGGVKAPNEALVELAKLAVAGRLRRAAELGSLVPDLALARLAPLLAPGADCAGQRLATDAGSL